MSKRPSGSSGGSMATSSTLSFFFIFIFFVKFIAIAEAAGEEDNNDKKKKNGLGASFIFGDSLVDAGNNNYLSTLSKANIKPNGIDFKPSNGNPTGRFTNGRTIGDIVGEELGQPNYAIPFLAPNATGKAILYGVNYASGGGGILNATGRIFVNRLGMDVQVDFFNVTRKQFDEILGKDEARDYIRKKSIFSITIGANDFLNNYLFPVLSVGTRFTQTPDDFVTDMLNHLRDQLMRLYNLDARKFVIGNVGPIGCIPYQKTINQMDKEECVDLANKLANQYNARLKSMLEDLNKNLHDATFVHANVYDLVMELITNYKKYGFKTATTACCGNGGQFAGIIPCGPTSSMCQERDKYVFWDPYHPSEAANLIIAKQLLYGSTEYISPVNLKNLRDL
ncbi:PREDICTED: GDSL esterase/lipase At2g23540 [Tarenaya hassleriana]|uniref:GDSL esterase/lipase At2g23540 n=1 Tax=Tarenaya hassleriana TaxID=28532 RepID=UPI00053C662C|nr:PREDICTED: GDSL esterase/lipase At2g23540 [Tarenaya hassleriana]